jgi:Transglycosylase SLT domain
MDPVRQAIIDAARRSGIPPAVALAFAERESSFNPAARSSKTIQGLFQMRGDHRGRYGVGDSLDPGEQTEGWGRFAHDLRKEMAAGLGRDPTWTETYLGHHFGGGRASRMLGMDPNTPVNAVFKPHELEVNPHIVKAGTVGKLLSSINTDMSRRIAREGGEEPQELPDFASYGELVDAPSLAPAAPRAAPQRVAEAPDFSAYGTLVN